LNLSRHGRENSLWGMAWGIGAWGRLEKGET
jgi:hypothetical protein